jgi:hypothetical protein
MKTLRWGIFGLSLALVLAALGDNRADAQQRQDIQKRLEQLQQRGIGQAGGPLVSAEAKDKLNLTAEQKEKVAKLEKEFEEITGKAREALQKALQDRSSGSTVPREKLREMREATEKLRTEYEGKLTALLTDEQKRKFEEAKQTARPRGGFGQNLPNLQNIRPFGRGDDQGLQSKDVQEKLNLNNEQKTKLEQLQKEFEAKQLEVLTEEQKKKYEELKKQPARPNIRRPGGNR